MSSEPTASVTDMTCDDVESLIPLVADGILDDDSDPALFAHIGRCVTCQESLANCDLIQIALERSSEQQSSSSTTATKLVFPRWQHHRLPWPVAMAASLCAAIGLWGWLNTMHKVPASNQTAQTQVIPVQTDNGHSVYVVFDGDNVTVIDPRSIDGKASLSKDAAIPVKLTK